jgi:putative membrane protein
MRGCIAPEEVTMTHLKSTLASLSTGRSRGLGPLDPEIGSRRFPGAPPASTVRNLCCGVLLSLACVAGAASCSSSASHANAPVASAAPTFTAPGLAMGEGNGSMEGPSSEAIPPASSQPRHPPSPAPAQVGTQMVATGNSSTGSGASAPVTWGVGSESAAAMGVTNQMGGATDVSSLNDAQYAAVIQAVNQGEIQEALLALSKATSADTKRFARDMAFVHRNMENKLNGLLSNLELTPSENAISNQIKSDTQNELQTLQTMRGKDFDRDYIDMQVTNHNKALELLDRIAPNVKSDELRIALTRVRPSIEDHLRQAERVQQSLQKGSTNVQPGSYGAPENTP